MSSSFVVTISAESFDDLKAKAIGLAKSLGHMPEQMEIPFPVKQEAATEAEPQAPKRGRKPKAEAVEVVSEPVAASEPVATPPVQAKLTKIEAHAALKKFFNAKGGPATLDVLKKFGATNISGVKEEQYNELVEALDKAS